MCKICSQSDLLSWRNIREDLKKFIHQIDAKFNLQKIILHGSFAKGDYHENSDIDLIIIGDFRGRIFDRIGEVLKYAPKGLTIEPFVYTPDEFKSMKDNNNPFIMNALSTGIEILSH